jgi:hypothetical protein
MHFREVGCGEAMKVMILASRCLLALSLVVWPSVSVSTAVAQTEPLPPPEPAMSPSGEGTDTWLNSRPLSATLTGAARVDYDAGVILFEEQDYTGAFIKFQRAFDACCGTWRCVRRACTTTQRCSA